MTTDERSAEQRHFLRSVVAAQDAVAVGEPARVRVKLRRDTPDGVVARIGGAVGLERYVTFRTPGLHHVPITVQHEDGRIDRTMIEFEATEACAEHPYPLLRVRQEPTNPFQLTIDFENADSIMRDGVRFEWKIDGYGSFEITRPFFVVDCERLLNSYDTTIAFDLHVAVIYPDYGRRTTSESFRVFNDYAWFRSRGVLKPRLSYDFRARGVKHQIAATCVMTNDEPEPIQLTARQLEILYDHPDREFVPGAPKPYDAIIDPESSRDLDCSIPRESLPEDALGYAIHFHGRTGSGLKVEASAYFEHYLYKSNIWTRITTHDALDLLREVKLAVADSSAPVGGLTPASRPPLLNQQLTVTTVRSFVDAMRPTWSPAERVRFDAGLYEIVGGIQHVRDQPNDSFLVGKQCLPDEEPPSDDLVCQLADRRGQVYVPARIINGKKGDLVLLPGGPLGIIGGLLQSVEPAQNYSHCGIMTANFYRVRHATASEEWLEDEVYGRAILGDRGTDGFSPDSLKYIWPGTVDQTVEEAFSGSFFQYRSADGKRQKAYKIQAFGRDPTYFHKDRHIAFPLVVKPDPLLEADPRFPTLRKTLAQVAEQAKRINGHYRFFCYSDGAISLADDVQHRAPDRGPSWWASGTRPMVCSTLFIAAIGDITERPVRVEGKRPFVSQGDLEKSPLPSAPDRFADVDELTRDGLYLYTEDERLRAAEFLYGEVYEKIYEKADDFGRLITDAPDDGANQMCNAFAFDYTDREFDDEDAKDSEKWKHPGVGRTVSPDDVLRFWDSPSVDTPELVQGLYGSAHRMQFRDGFLEEREIGKWVKREKIGKLTVTVTHHDRPIAGADVRVGGQVPVTNAHGVVLIELPEGRYEVGAGAFLNGLFAEGKGTAEVKDRGATSVRIELNDPPELNRLVVIGGRVRIKDEENVGEDEFLDGSWSVAPKRVGPTHKQDSVTYVRKWGGEIRVEARFDLAWTPDLSVTVAYHVNLYEGASEDTDDKDGEKGGVVRVERDQQNVPVSVFVRNDDEDDDDYVLLEVYIANLVDQ